MEGFWLWQLMGRLHPMVVHFPIALLIFGAFLELATIGKFHSKLRPGINLLVLAGAVSVLLSALLGFLLATHEGLEGELLDLHRISGIVAAGLSVAVLFLLNQVWKKNQTKSIKAYRAALFLTAIGVGVSGHFGASMTHGENFLTETFPWSDNLGKTENNFNLASYETAELSPDQEMQLIGEVRTVLAHNCYKCHSGAKIEGKLRLDEKEFVFKGGESGAILVPGNPDASEIIRRISLPKNHKDVMPSKGKHLSREDIDLIGFWIAKGAPWPDGAAQKSVYRVAELAPRKPALPQSIPGLENPVDLWVNSYFEENGISWQPVVDDRTFLRRIYLDVVGLIPSPEDLEAFANDPDPDKRAIWLRKLLDRNADYATHWLTFWNDALRNDYTGTGYITNGRYNITDWLYKSLQSNKPYDVFVKELLNPNDASKGFIEGIRWRGTVNASQRTEMQAAQNVGQVILGLNLKCASCHDSFISDWKLDQAYAFANIFADTTLEVSRCEKPIGKLASTKILWEELGTIDSTAARTEKLFQLSEYLVQPANGRMYRTVVNRLWKQMMGRGIVEPVDEMDNEPWSQDLLDWLAVDFVEKGYDLKELIFLIGTSKIYQSPTVGYQSQDLLLADDFVFEGMVRRRMTAEQFSDAVSQVFNPVFEEKDLKYNPNQLIPEQKNRIPYARASLVANNAFHTALGRPNREIVSTSRDSQASLLQALELTNGDKLNAVLQKAAEKWKENYREGPAIIAEVYSKALLRKPSKKESEIALAALGNDPDTEQLQDFFWAVVLLPEFQFLY